MKYNSYKNTAFFVYEYSDVRWENPVFVCYSKQALARHFNVSVQRVHENISKHQGFRLRGHNYRVHPVKIDGE